MAEYYKSICELTLKYRDSKEVVVRKAVITLIPSMATYDSDVFEANYLNRSMAYLLQALEKATDRDIGMAQIIEYRETDVPSICCTRAYGCSAHLEDAAVNR